MLNTVFTLGILPMFAVFAAIGLVSFLVAYGVLALLHRGALEHAGAVPVAPFFTSITTAWALALGFAAADIWSINSQAQQAASAERSTLTRIMGSALPTALDLPDAIAAIDAYFSAVRDVEWGRDHNRRSDEGVDEALQDIRLSIIDAVDAGVPDSLIAKIVQDFDELQDARDTRLAIAKGNRNEYKWYLVLVLMLLSQIAIAAVHADKPRAGRNGLVIFTVAAAISMWILALHAHPYMGVAQVPPIELRIVL